MDKMKHMSNGSFTVMEEVNRKRYQVSQRYVMLLFLFFTNVFLMCFRVILSVTIVYMTPSSSAAPEDNNASHLQRCDAQDQLANASTKTTEFDWNGELQSQLLGAYFWGFISTQLLGGLVATRFGPKWTLAVAIGIPAVLTLLTPVVTRHNVYALLAIRVVMGLCSGFSIPSVYVVLSKWAHKSEMSFFGSIVYNGINVGTFVALGLSGYLCSTNVDGGWPLPFYIFGGMGVVWLALWVIFGSESPSKSIYISENELTYLKENISHTGNIQCKETPWFHILKCVPFWAMVISNFAHNWVLDFSNVTIPSYLGRILGFNILSNGVLSGLPFLLKIPFSVLLSIVCDWIYAKYALSSTTKMRKFCTCIGFLGSGVSFLLVPFVRCDKIVAISLMCVGLAFSGFHSSGFLYSYIELARRFSGILIGISNTFGNVAGFAVPSTVAQLTSTVDSLDTWQYIFYITTAVQIVAGVAFLIFGSSEKQSWASN